MFAVSQEGICITKHDSNIYLRNTVDANKKIKVARYLANSSF